MARAHATLANMLQGPMTGYDPVKQLSQTSGFFWRRRTSRSAWSSPSWRGKGLIAAVPDESP